MYEHETVEHRKSCKTVWILLPPRKQRTKRLLRRHMATERETRVRERVRRIEDFFLAGQVAFNLRIPYPTGYGFEE
jgi:dephospho-CoA kinase